MSMSMENHIKFRALNSPTRYGTPKRFRANKVLGDIYSDNPSWERFLFGAVDAISNNFPQAELEETGVITNKNGSWYPGGIERILFASGIPMDPLGSIPENKDLVVSDELLKSIGEVSDYLLRNFSPDTVKINAFSQSGVPHFTYDVFRKWEMMQKSLEMGDVIVKAYNDKDKKKIKDLYYMSDIVYLYTLGERMQPRSLTKDSQGRYRVKETYVTNIKGERVLANFEEPFPGSRLFRMRYRTVYALSGTISYMLQHFSAALRKHLHDNFGFLFVHRGDFDLTQKMSNYKTAIGSDFVSFDTTFNRSIIEAIYKNAPFGKEMNNFIIESQFFPVLLKPDRSSDYYSEPFLQIRGSVEEPWLEAVIKGNPSGNPFVDITAKLGALGAMWHVIKSVFKDITLKEYFSGTSSDIAILNLGDDCLNLTNREDKVPELLKALSGGVDVSPFILEIEKPTTFVGHHVIREDGKLKAVRRFTAFFENRFARERGIDSKLVKYWRLGFNESRNLHMSHPMGHESYTIVDHVFRSNFGLFMGEIVGQSEVPSSELVLSNIDREVLSDPSKAVWKFRTSDINPELLNRLFKSVPKDESAKHIERILNRLH